MVTALAPGEEPEHQNVFFIIPHRCHRLVSLSRLSATYVWDEANLIKVVAQLRVVEGNHLGEDRQVL